MKNLVKAFHFIVIVIFVVSTIKCNSQSIEHVDREPVVAGAFYPENPEQLNAYLDALFAQCEFMKTYNDVLALIVPHAGYVFSGKVAASGYNQLDPDKAYDNIFIIATSHRKVFMGASIYNQGDYNTPLGKVKVNRELANKLISENEIFIFDPEAHSDEHSLEVQLPFLQYKMKKDFQIVPIVTGAQTLGEIKEMAKVLSPYLNKNNLFIISTDFSHYPKYEDAVQADKRASDAILSNSVIDVINAISENEAANYDNLVTSLCGWPAVLTLLNITEKKPYIKTIHIDYQNSGDVSDDKSRVVGYHSIVFAKKKEHNMSQNKFVLSSSEKENLLLLARNTIAEYLKKGKAPSVNDSMLTKAMKEKCGAFVTLHKNGQLRGCIGRFVASEPLYMIIQQMAIAAATEDSRFSMVEEEELGEIDIEISVLTPLEKIDSIDQIEMGRHGIYIKKGFNSGTFLPQVAMETGWTKEEFLGYCSKNKAGLGWDGWKDADIYIYEALIFAEKGK